jgi:porin
MKYLALFFTIISSLLYAQEPKEAYSFAYETYDNNNSYDSDLKLNQEDDDFCSKALGDFCGKRKDLKDDGLEVISTLTIDDTWNLGGGFAPTKKFGDGQWLYFLGLKFDLEKTFLNDKGGTFFIELANKGGINPTYQSIGSYNFVDNIESPSGTQIYSLYYKHTFENGASILIGKSDAYEYFSNMEHVKYFINGGYTNFAPFDILPTYPYPAMGIVAFTPITSCSTLAFGIYDSSFYYINPNVDNSIFGKFFNHLEDHAFLIAELDFEWELAKNLKGRFGLGGWYNSVTTPTFEDTMQRGIRGFYFTFDQILYTKGDKNAAFFCSFSASDPKVEVSPYYFCSGITLQGFNCFNPLDTIGIGVSRSFFTNIPEADFINSFEASYELFYVFNLYNGIYLQPDYQYVQNPGGMGIPNASVFTLRLNLDF